MRFKFLAIGLVAALSSSVAYAEALEVHGSSTVAANLLAPKKGEIEKAAGVELQIVANGSGRGLADLVEGKVKLAMISAPLEDEVKSLKAKGANFDETKIQAHKVGEAPAAFAVHPSNPVKRLSEAQMADILSGKITNWKDVGGADKAIVVVCETKGGGVRSQVEHDFLQGGAIAAEKRELPQATQIVKVVGQLDAALGIVSKVTVTSEVAELDGGRKVVQPLIFLTLGDPSAEAARVIAAAKAAGGG
jgi:phosphate transport system substrate-binding protein